MDPKLKAGLIAGSSVLFLSSLVLVVVLVNLPRDPAQGKTSRPATTSKIAKADSRSETLQPGNSKAYPAPSGKPAGRKRFEEEDDPVLPPARQRPVGDDHPSNKSPGEIMPRQGEPQPAGKTGVAAEAKDPSKGDKPVLTDPQAPVAGQDSAKTKKRDKDLEPETDPLVTAMIKELKTRRLRDRIKAAEALGQMGPRAKVASRVLCEACVDTNPALRIAAGAALERINPVIYALVVPVLTDNVAKRRSDAITQIEKLGFEGKPAVPVLLYFKTNVVNGSQLVKALVATASDEKEITNLFLAWLIRDSNELVRMEVAESLPLMEGGKEGIKVLTVALQTDRALGVRIAAAKALGQFGSDAREAIQALTVAKRDPSPELRDAAGKAIEKINKDQ